MSLGDEKVPPKSSNRKRSMHSSDGEHNNKRPRGRPRVEPHGETAADRRRTQIRLAQRSYRMRKEVTIASSKQENAQLRSIITEMKNVFTKFKSRAEVAGLNTAVGCVLAHDLLRTASIFERLARDAEEDSLPHQDDSNQSNIDDLRNSIPLPLNDRSISASVTEDKKIYPIPSPEANSSLGAPDSSLGLHASHSQFIESNLGSLMPSDGARHYNAVVNASGTSRELSYPTEALAPPPTGYSEYGSMALARPSLTVMSLPITNTYSYMETTFSRQLHRACLEQAFYLLTSPNPKPDVVMHKFKYVLYKSSIPELRDRIGKRLSRAAFEPLDGTGLYPCVGRGFHENVNLCSQGKILEKSSFAPTTLQASQLIQHEAQEQWLSMEDVQAYIESKGVHITPQSTFAEGEIVSLAQGADLRTDAFCSASLYSPPLTPESWIQDESMKLTTNWPNDKNNCSSDKSWEQPHPPALKSELGPSTNLPRIGLHRDLFWKRTKFILDVTRFVNALSDYSVCRGKTPGLRMADIDQAFRHATIVVR